MSNPFVFEPVPPAGAPPCGCRPKTTNQEAIAPELEEEFGRFRPTMRPSSARQPLRRRGFSRSAMRRSPLPRRRALASARLPYIPIRTWAPPAIVAEPFPEPSQPDGGAPEPAAATPEPADDQVRSAQECLNKVMKLELAVSGVLDAPTRSALRSLQQERGLPVDGTLNPETDSALREACGGESPAASTEFEMEVRRAPRGPVKPPARRLPVRPGLARGAAGGAAPVPAGAAPAGTGCNRPLLRGACLDQFDFSKFTVKDSHRPQIRGLAQCIVASQRTCSPITSVTLVGHTDPVGSLAANERLGRQRAESVRNELRETVKRLSPGLEAQILFNVRSRGETDPVDLNQRERDRRVEVFLHNTITDPSGCVPHKARLRMHIKIFQDPCVPIAIMVGNMKRLYGLAGFLVEVASTERLKGLPNLDGNDAIDIGDCVEGTVTAEETLLYNNRNNVKNNEIVAYFVRATSPIAVNGCAAHPPGRPGVIVTSTASEWTLAHEVGHVLTLAHPDQDVDAQRLLFDRLMTSGGTANITGVPRLLPCEIRAMDASPLTVDC